MVQVYLVVSLVFQEGKEGEGVLVAEQSWGSGGGRWELGQDLGLSPRS